MTPSLLGRLQTRLLLVVAFGLPWTILLLPVVATIADGDWAMAIRATLTALALVGVLGLVVWEPLYHLLQQYRWEKDWPTSLGLFTALNEGVVVWVLLDRMLGVSFSTFVTHFVTTWLLLWFVVHGPLRVLALRWRYRGGRLI